MGGCSRRRRVARAAPCGLRGLREARLSTLLARHPRAATRRPQDAPRTASNTWKPHICGVCMCVRVCVCVCVCVRARARVCQPPHLHDVVVDNITQGAPHQRPQRALAAELDDLAGPRPRHRHACEGAGAVKRACMVAVLCVAGQRRAVAEHLQRLQAVLCASLEASVDVQLAGGSCRLKAGTAAQHGVHPRRCGGPKASNAVAQGGARASSLASCARRLNSCAAPCQSEGSRPRQRCNCRRHNSAKGRQARE